MMTDSVIVHQSSLRTQWWLVHKYCVSHHCAYRDKECSNSQYSARSDNWYSNSASVNTTYTVMTDTAILRQSTLRTQRWLIQQYCVSRHYVHTIVRQLTLRTQWWLIQQYCVSRHYVHTIVRQSTLRTQWWLIQHYCVSRHYVHSDVWYSNIASVDTTYTVMTDTAILRQSSLCSYWWLIQ